MLLLFKNFEELRWSEPKAPGIQIIVLMWKNNFDTKLNKIRDLFKVKLYTIRSETKKEQEREIEKWERERSERERERSERERVRSESEREVREKWERKKWEKKNEGERKKERETLSIYQP